MEKATARLLVSGMSEKDVRDTLVEAWCASDAQGNVIYELAARVASLCDVEIPETEGGNDDK